MKKLIFTILYFLNGLVFAPKFLDKTDQKKIWIYHFPQAKEELEIANKLQEIIDYALKLEVQDPTFECRLMDLEIKFEDICDLLNAREFSFLYDDFEAKNPGKIILFCSFLKEKFLVFANLYKELFWIRDKSFDNFLIYSFFITKCPEFQVKIHCLEKLLSCLLSSNYSRLNDFFELGKSNFFADQFYPKNLYFKKAKAELNDYSNQRMSHLAHLFDFKNLRNLRICRDSYEEIVFAKHEFITAGLLNFWIKINRDYVESMAYKACEFGILDRKHLEKNFDILFSNKYNMFQETEPIDKSSFIQDWLSQVSTPE